MTARLDVGWPQTNTHPNTDAGQSSDAWFAHSTKEITFRDINFSGNETRNEEEHPMKKLLVALAVLASASAQSQAGDCCKAAATCAPCPQQVACQAQPACQPAVQWKEVERTVLVPEWGTEKRTVCRTEYKQETSEREITVNKWVQKKDKVSREVTYYECEKKWKDVTHKVAKHNWKDVETKYWVNVPTRETKTGTRTVRKPHWKEVDHEYTVMVPSMETQTQKYWVWESHPVKKTRKVCEDKGHWEEKQVQVGGCNPCQSACGSCNTCCNPCPVTCTQKVWVPNIVETEVEYTTHECRKVEKTREVQVCVSKPVKKTCKRKVCEWVEEEEEYTYEVCGWKKEEKTCTRKVCETTWEEVTQKVEYSEWVAKTKTVEDTVCRWECVPTKKTIKETRCVPVQVKEEVDVKVCRMVEKTIKEKVCVPAPAPCNAQPAAPCNACSKPAPCKSSCNSCCS